MTPIGTKHQHNTAQIVLTLEADVPAGSTLYCVASAAGHTNWPITAQIGSKAPAFMEGGDTGFFADTNQVERIFAEDVPDGLSAGDTVTITMTNAGQGFSTIMWASAFYG